MLEKIESEVFVVFQDKELSCDDDSADGFIIVWDSDELSRNLTTSQLIEEVGKIDNDVYQAVINYLFKELEISYGESSKYLDDYYFEEVFDFLQEQIGACVFYRFYYQSVGFIKEIHKTEESAKKMVDYYTKNHSYKNKVYYVKYRLVGGES